MLQHLADLVDVPEIAEALPWFMMEPEDVASQYMQGPYLVLDLETTTLDYGDANNVNNEIVAASWYRSGTDKVHYKYGNEYEQLGLMTAVEKVLNDGGFIVAHNAKFEIKWLQRMGLDPARVLCYDTMLGEHVIRGNRMHMKVNLNDTAQRYGCTAKAYYVDLWLKNGIDTKAMPEPLVRARVVKDVKDTTRSFLRQREVLFNRGQLEVQVTRCLFTPVLADMEMQGIFLNKPLVDKEYRQVLRQYTLAQSDWNNKYGEVNPRSVPQMAKLIYEDLKFKELKDRRGKPIRNKPTKAFPDGAPKVDNGTLDKLVATTRKQKEFIQKRKTIGSLSAKLSKTLDFFKGICDTTEDHVFYGQFNQAVTQTHRLSSSSVRVEFEDGTEKGVQLQNMAREYKPLIGAGHHDWLVGEADGSQLEFRVAAFLGQDENAINDIRNDVDRHEQTAKELYGYTDASWGQLSKADRKILRQNAKAETFKPLYGGSRGTPEQERYYKWFREQFPDLAATQEGWTYEVLANKSLRMDWGMEWYWPHTKQDPRTGYIDNTPSIYNYPVQSLATAEIIPIAVTYLWHRIRACRANIQLFNTVHDSAIARFPEAERTLFRDLSIVAFTGDVYSYLRRVYGMNFNVPLGVGVTIGKVWADPNGEEFEINVERDGTYWEKGTRKA